MKNRDPVRLVFCLSAMVAARCAQAQPDEKKPAQGQQVSAALTPADRLFRSGEFDNARMEYKQVLAESPGDFRAILRLGEIALLGNALDEAIDFLSRARAIPEAKETATKLLAEAYHRKDDYQKAAPLYREAGRSAFADLLDSFMDKRPYDLGPGFSTTAIDFEQTDPLPVVKARINGSEPVYFILDTGAGHTILDPEFADSIAAVRFGAEEGTFAGEKKAESIHARIDSLQIGDATLRNLPVSLLSTRRFSAVASGRRIDGVIGTLLFRRFRTTLDYPNGKLILERAEQDSPLAKYDHEIPFWLAGDHLLLAHGRANASEPCLMFVDTGLAGGGFTCPESTLNAAGVDLSSAPSFDGVGGGGPVKVRPFVMKKLSLGPVTRTGITSFYGPFPESLEYRQGFQICGLVSHAFFRPYAVTLDFSRMRILIDEKR